MKEDERHEIFGCNRVELCQIFAAPGTFVFEELRHEI